MKNRYNEIMQDIKVTEEMHDRIINNIEHIDFYTNQRKVINFKGYKKYMAIAACLILLVVSATVIPNMIKPNLNPPVQGPTNIVEYATIEKLSDAVGFNVTEINEIPFEVEQVTYTAYGKELAEINYANKVESIIFRKSVGNEDNSGDYNAYTTVKDVLINKQAITIKGNTEKCNLVIWETDGYSYSLQSSVGVSENEMLEMVRSVQ